MRELPKSIEPDRLKDAIVEIRYNSSIPQELITGLVFDSLDETYFYTNRPIALNNSNNNPRVILPVFYNERIKVLLRGNSLIFNILEKYIGWDLYEKEIEKFLSQINNSNKDVFKEFTRVGIRFVSEYEEIDIRDSFKFKFSFDMPKVKSDVFAFRSEFKIDHLNVFLHLQNKIRVSISPNKEIRVSTVDIDVSNQNLKYESIEQIMKVINESHTLQKKIFFDLIKEDFLKQLNPKY